MAGGRNAIGDVTSRSHAGPDAPTILTGMSQPPPNPAWGPPSDSTAAQGQQPPRPWPPGPAQVPPGGRQQVTAPPGPPPSGGGQPMPAPSGWQPGPPAGYGYPPIGHGAAAPAPPSPPTPPRRSALPIVLALVVGLLVGAGVMTALALTGVVGGTSAAEPDTTPITLPGTLPGLVLQTQAIAATGGSSAAEATERLQQTRDRTIPALSAAYGGAAADVQLYSTADLTEFTTVHAVRGESPGLTLPTVQDAEALGLAAPQQEIKRYGEVECLVVMVSVTPAGEETSDEDFLPSMCQRTAEGLTVRVYSVSETTVDTAVSRTNAAFEAVKG